jgi:hypothetical protein
MKEPEKALVLGDGRIRIMPFEEKPPPASKVAHLEQTSNRECVLYKDAK